MRKRIAYCEDEQIHIDFMKHLCQSWSEQSLIDLDFSGYLSGEAFLFENGESYPYDLICIDIDLGETNGMDLARTIRKKDGQVPIIFLTNRKDYVFEGYEVQALRYILKPLEQSKWNLILDELFGSSQKEKKYLLERIDGESYKIDLEQILYFEAQGHYTICYEKDKEYRIRKGMSSIQEVVKKQCEQDFFLTHRSFLVNLKYVNKIGKDSCDLEGGRQVPVSRNAYRNFQEAFIQYYKGK